MPNEPARALDLGELLRAPRLALAGSIWLALSIQYAWLVRLAGSTQPTWPVLVASISASGGPAKLLELGDCSGMRARELGAWQRAGSLHGLFWLPRSAQATGPLNFLNLATALARSAVPDVMPTVGARPGRPAERLRPWLALAGPIRDLCKRVRTGRTAERLGSPGWPDPRSMYTRSYWATR